VCCKSLSYRRANIVNHILFEENWTLKKQTLIAIILLILLIAVPTCSAAASLSKPSVTLPSGWAPNGETPYPDAMSEHDPAGAGLLEYTDTVNYAWISLYYEKTSMSYTDPQLKAEAEDLFSTYESTYYVESGVRNFGGNKAGWATAYDPDTEAYDLVFVMTKEGYYINVLASYENASQIAVESILGSIRPTGNNGAAILGLDMTLFIVIIGAVVAIIIVVAVVVAVKRRKKPMKQIAQGSIPPPPPPPA
jgi:hypothetical protein